MKAVESVCEGTSSSMAVTSTFAVFLPTGMLTVCGKEKRLAFSQDNVTSSGLFFTVMEELTVSWKVSPSVMVLFEAVSVRLANSLSMMTNWPVAVS